jgi:hypothetical protein
MIPIIGVKTRLLGIQRNPIMMLGDVHALVCLACARTIGISAVNCIKLNDFFDTISVLRQIFCYALHGDVDLRCRSAGACARRG